MRAMNHPEYRYQPWTPERRARASRAAKQRWANRGAPDAAGRAWTENDLCLLRELHAKGLSARQIGARLKRSRNAVLGKIYRTGISQSPGEHVIDPPAGLHRVPAAEIRKLAEDHMKTDGPEAEAAAFCIAPLFGIISPKAISNYLGIPRDRAEIFGRRLRANGIWGPKGPLSHSRYTEEGDEAFITLVLDALVCLGQVRRTVNADGEDMWQKA